MYVYHFYKTEWKITNILNRILLTYICRNGLICITYADKYIETSYSNHSIFESHCLVMIVMFYVIPNKPLLIPAIQTSFLDVIFL